ncbi:MAG: hypothetical protein ACJ71N_08650 [Terriglobales bacterium]
MKRNTDSKWEYRSLSLAEFGYPYWMYENRHDRRIHKATHKHVARVLPTKFQKIGFALIGLMIFGSGARALLNGRLHYSNWWGLPVFAPFAVIIAILILAIACYGIWKAK